MLNKFSCICDSNILFDVNDQSLKPPRTRMIGNRDKKNRNKRGVRDEMIWMSHKLDKTLEEIGKIIIYIRIL